MYEGVLLCVVLQRDAAASKARVTVLRGRKLGDQIRKHRFHVRSAKTDCTPVLFRMFHGRMLGTGTFFLRESMPQTIQTLWQSLSVASIHTRALGSGWTTACSLYLGVKEGTLIANAIQCFFPALLPGEEPLKRVVFALGKDTVESNPEIGIAQYPAMRLIRYVRRHFRRVSGGGPLLLGCSFRRHGEGVGCAGRGAGGGDRV
ncbi:hypothetical protein EI94DRAFT_718564 [Lactarius quietus]|nr:hypothetical protein EI94DRAFT_718564 [Lactarius quietus]